MTSIFTRKGEEILIDDEDLELVSQFTWCINRGGYVQAHVPGSKKEGVSCHGRKVYLHQILLPSTFEVHHKNENKLDNQRSTNLRETTRAVNERCKTFGPSRGITRTPCGNFVARIGFRKDSKFSKHGLGTFKSFDLALLARIIGEIRYWGEPTQRMP